MLGGRRADVASAPPEPVPALRRRPSRSSSRCMATRRAFTKISSRSASRIMPGAVQIVFGVENPNDPAIAVVERLRAAYPGHGDRTRGRTARDGLQSEGRQPHQHAANASLTKSSCWPTAISACDAIICRAWSARSNVLAAPSRCPYYGISTGSLWSELAQLTIDSHFLPGRRGRRAAEAVAAVPRLDHRAAPAIADGDRRLRAARRLPGRRLRARASLLQQRGEPVTVLPFAVGHVCGEIVVPRIVAARAALGADHPHHRPARLSRLGRDARVSAGADRLGLGRRRGRDRPWLWRRWPAGPS